MQLPVERFCIASGQKVSLEKSQIFFSENVHRDLAKLISDESGIKATKELGKYLGMPILHKRINKDTFGDVVERVNSRLSGWKGRFLSLAGRITLTKSVLSSLPVHTMTTILLPATTLERLEKISRSFVWGSTVEKRRLHLLAWDRVCLPKTAGGLGIRSSKQMNKSLIAKIGWRLLHDDKSLWARVLRSKYRVGKVHDPSWLVVKSGWSPTWRSVGTGLREVVLPGLSWVLGDGKDIKFWQDKWLTDKPLCELVSNVLPGDAIDLRARDLWKYDTGWDLNRIVPYVSETTMLRLASIVVDTVTGAKDRTSWGECSDGCFSVRSAYSLLTLQTNPTQNMKQFYTRLWSLVTQERIRVFIWLVSQQVIMTNVERYRRHLGDSDLCQVCKAGAETIMHVLRDCPAMSGVWVRLVPHRKQQHFFSQSLLEWIYENVGDNTIMSGYPWAVLFAQAIWWSWKWRCGNVFNVGGKCRDRVRFLRELAKEVWAAHEAVKVSGHRVQREERLIAWKPPQEGWFKLNTDGASHGNPGDATAGGVLRDEAGNWCSGFALNIGICSAPLAELWGVYYGLYIARARGITRLELEVDSEMVVNFLNTRISDSHPLSFLVRLCYGFISKDWIVRVSHVYREANRLADGLANYAFSLPLGFHLLNFAPDSVRSIVLEDVNGSAYPRNVRL